MRYRTVQEADTVGGMPPALAEINAAYQQYRREKWEIITLNLETVTPIYGGGVEAGQPDLLAPLRPRAIRNGIKHWWWLLYRHQYITAKGYSDQTKLFEAMTNIWGGATDDETDASAKVRVTVTPPLFDRVKTAAFAPYRIDPVKKDGQDVLGPDKKYVLLRLTADAKHPYTYAIFGARGELNKVIPQDMLQKLRPVCEAAYGNRTSYELNGSRQAYFDKLVGCPAFWKKRPAQLILPGLAFAISIAISKEGIDESQRLQVIEAIKWWIMFGGVGARTARGMGKLMLVGSSTSFGLATNPMLPTGFSCGSQLGAFPSGEAAMLALLQKYREFRQSRPVGRGRPGQSHWPKADVVRHRTGKNDAGAHPPRWIMSGGVPPPSPFAEAMADLLFGAPIVVSFDPTGKQKAVLDFETNSQHLERYSSPLIFGFVPNQDGELRAAALVLRIGVDFMALRPAARVNWNDGLGDHTCSVPYGEWWPKWEDQTYKRDATALTGKVLPAATFGAMTPLAAFLKYMNVPS